MYMQWLPGGTGSYRASVADVRCRVGLWWAACCAQSKQAHGRHARELAWGGWRFQRQTMEITFKARQKTLYLIVVGTGKVWQG